MNFELEDEISTLLADGKLDAAILLLKAKLTEQPPTDFNKLLGKDLLHHYPLRLQELVRVTTKTAENKFILGDNSCICFAHDFCDTVYKAN